MKRPGGFDRGFESEPFEREAESAQRQRTRANRGAADQVAADHSNTSQGEENSPLRQPASLLRMRQRGTQESLPGQGGAARERDTRDETPFGETVVRDASARVGLTEVDDDANLTVPLPDDLLPRRKRWHWGKAPRAEAASSSPVDARPPAMSSEATGLGDATRTGGMTGVGDLTGVDSEHDSATETALAGIVPIVDTGALAESVVSGPREANVRGARLHLREALRARKTRERREQRRFTAHLRRRRRYWLVGISAVLGLGLFVAVGVYTPLMAVREVRIEGAEQVNIEELQQAMTQFHGTPLALIDDQKVHSTLVSFALIERYAIERIPPQTLVLRIEEREAVIAIARDDVFALYDPAGVQIGSLAEAPAGVPVAAGSVLDPASESFAAAGRIVRDMPEDIRASLVGVEASSAQQVTFVLDSGTRVVWGNAEDTQQKSVVLRTMINRLGAVSTIDVSAPATPVFTQ